MGKTVAICQFGGELVTNNDGSMSYNGGEAHAIQVLPTMKFDEFKSEIAEMCNCNVSTLSIKYFLPSNRRIPIVISNDKDMQRMIDFHEDSATIDVFVLEGGAVAQNAVKAINNRATGAASRTTSRAASRTMRRAVATDSINPIPTTVNNDRTITVTDLITPIATIVATGGVDGTVSGNIGRATSADPITPIATTTTVISNDMRPGLLSLIDESNDKQPGLSSLTDESNDKRPGLLSFTEESNDKQPGLLSFTDESNDKRPGLLSFTDESNDKRPGLLSSADKLIVDVGQEFSNVHDFRDALRRFAIAKGFIFTYVNNDSKRVTAKCKAEGCPWRVHASRLSTMQKFKIKTINNVHTCGGGVGKDGHPHATRRWVASIIKDKVRDMPQYKPRDIANDIYREYGVSLRYHQARRGKEMAQEQLQGSRAEAYNQLPWLCERIRETNPGSLVTLTTTDDSRFHRLFISFHASRHGFENGCRPLILLDGTSLRDKCHGTLLAAVSVDGDDGIFPIAFAVVDTESSDNWHWFLSELKLAVPMNQTITFVSDRRNGLEETVPEIFKDSYHAYSLHHLTEDFKRVLKGPSQMVKDALVDEFKRAAYLFGAANFNACIDSIRNVSHDVAAWVLESKPEHWSNAFFRGSRYDHVSSSVAELFYGWISEERDVSIIQMIDMIRCKMMEMIYTRREASSAWSTVLTPSMEQRLQLEMYNSRTLSVLFSSGSVFEVRDDSVNIVDIETRDCTCQRWKMFGLPCIHAAAVFDRTGKNMYDYCSRYFTVDCYRLAYSESIHPIPDIGKPVSEDSNTQIIVRPPRIHRPRQPPRWPKKKKRNLPLDRSKKLRHCSRCGAAGHNMATCKEPEMENA
ncbi:uncharacterized protein LOC131246534 isoform X2 [Magnolia sinica]|nr:uncharacterized protein LOC131246534 isoform X2 [Magnolia sinica]XP_058102739.1 uncharacterized protein LOC131246534 isoform X2 [Magnolia sinica]